MRTPSPHWMQPNPNNNNHNGPTPKQVMDSSVASVRRSPLPSAASPQLTTQPVSIQEPIIPIPHNHSNHQPIPIPPVINQMNNIGASSDGQSELPAPAPSPTPQAVAQRPAIAVPVVTDSYLPAILSNEQFFPLVLDKMGEDGDSRAQESDADGDTEGPATVIPLITELGIKD